MRTERRANRSLASPALGPTQVAGARAHAIREERTVRPAIAAGKSAPLGAAESLERYLRAVKRSRSAGELTATPSLAPSPGIDLSPGSEKLAKMSEIAARYGIDFDNLKSALARLSHVDRLENLGNMGPPDASVGGHFDCLFGRDPQEQAKNLGAVLGPAGRRSPEFPDVIRATVMRHASLQAQGYSFARDAEKGEILHEHRDDARGRELEAAGWAFPYYGATDSTPVHVRLIWDYLELYPKSGFLDEAVQLDPAVNAEGASMTLRESAIEATLWTLRRLDDPRGGGLLYNQREPGHPGITNQVWKDSRDSYPFDGPYAPIECQGYAYDELLCLAEMLEASPGPGYLAVLAKQTAAKLRDRAETLRERVLDAFALVDAEGEVVALDHAIKVEDGQVVRAGWITSNPGRLLQTRMLDGDPARPEIAEARDAIVRRLLAPDMLGEAGVLTLSRDHPKYGPGDYHNGSIWPTDTMSFIEGLVRHGYEREAKDLIDRMLGSIGRAQALALGFDYSEFFRSDDRLITKEGEEVYAETEGRRGLKEQPPQKTQGWTASAVWASLSWLADRALGRVPERTARSPKPARMVAAADERGGLTYVDQIALMRSRRPAG